MGERRAYKCVIHPPPQFLRGIHYGALNDCKQMVSGSISLRSLRFFSPFPHGTCSLSLKE